MMIEKIKGTMTESLELTVARAVPAKLTALVNAKKDSTNNKPKINPKETTVKENLESK